MSAPVTGRTVRVLLVDDSATARTALRALFASDPRFLVAGEAADGAAAIRLARTLRPDLVTMDLHMPGLDGLATTRRIMQETPTPIVVVSSAVTTADVAVALDCTRAGALLALPRPPFERTPEAARRRAQFLTAAHAMADVQVVRHWARPAREAPSGQGAPGTVPTAARDARVGAVRAVVVGASTGGPAAVHQLIAALGPTCPVPVLVVQHIAAGFAEGLVQWLRTATGLAVVVATDGEVPRAGVVYIAPDDEHLLVETAGDDGALRLRLAATPPHGGFRPAVDVLFESAADALGDAVIGVLLTGMGSDGAAGMRRLREAGAWTIAQDEASSVVYGMAQAAVAADAVDALLPLAEIAPRIRRLLESARP